MGSLLGELNEMARHSKKRADKGVVAPDIRLRYQAERPKFDLLMQEVDFILSEAISKVGIKIHQLETRVKPLESVLKKADEKGISDPFSELNDIGGARVICLFKSDLATIDELLRSSFQILSVDDKVSAGSDTF